jgi:hypothetical protein
VGPSHRNFDPFWLEICDQAQKEDAGTGPASLFGRPSGQPAAKPGRRIRRSFDMKDYTTQALSAPSLTLLLVHYGRAAGFVAGEIALISINLRDLTMLSVVSRNFLKSGDCSAACRRFGRFSHQGFCWNTSRATFAAVMALGQPA